MLREAPDSIRLEPDPARGASMNGVVRIAGIVAAVISIWGLLWFTGTIVFADRFAAFLGEDADRGGVILIGIVGIVACLLAGAFAILCRRSLRASRRIAAQPLLVEVRHDGVRTADRSLALAELRAIRVRWHGPRSAPVMSAGDHLGRAAVDAYEGRTGAGSTRTLHFDLRDGGVESVFVANYADDREFGRIVWALERTFPPQGVPVSVEGQARFDGRARFDG